MSHPYRAVPIGIHMGGPFRQEAATDERNLLHPAGQQVQHKATSATPRQADEHGQNALTDDRAGSMSNAELSSATLDAGQVADLQGGRAGGVYGGNRVGRAGDHGTVSAAEGSLRLAATGEDVVLAPIALQEDEPVRVHSWLSPQSMPRIRN
jgi:hypothetical protein